MLQDFTFETDDLNRFQDMLLAVYPLIMGKNCLVGLSQKKPPKYQIYSKPPYPLSKLGASYPSFATAYFLEGVYATGGEPFRRGTMPLHWFVCTLFALPVSPDPAPKRNRMFKEYLDKEEIKSFDSLQVGIQAVIEVIKATDPAPFVQLAGAKGPFDEGGAGIGYRMHTSGNAGHPFTISLCHIFYPK